MTALDVPAYLDRIHGQGPLEPNAETLRRLHLAHMLTVPFENLSIHWGEPIQLRDDALFDKVVARRRGGFCYELNGLRYGASTIRRWRRNVTQAEYEANGLQVRMVQVRDRERRGFLCRGWLQIRPAGGAAQWIYRGDIDPGGAFLVDLKRRLLFSQPFSDVPPSLAVLDLDRGKRHEEGGTWKGGRANLCVRPGESGEATARAPPRLNIAIPVAGERGLVLVSNCKGVYQAKNLCNRCFAVWPWRRSSMNLDGFTKYIVQLPARFSVLYKVDRMLRVIEVLMV